MSGKLLTRIERLETESANAKHTPIWFELKSDFLKQMTTSPRVAANADLQTVFIDQRGRHWLPMNDEARREVRV